MRIFWDQSLRQVLEHKNENASLLPRRTFHSNWETVVYIKNWKFKNSCVVGNIVWALKPNFLDLNLNSTTDCDSIFGDKVFKDVIKLKWCHKVGPYSSMIGVLI